MERNWLIVALILLGYLGVILVLAIMGERIEYAAYPKHRLEIIDLPAGTKD